MRGPADLKVWASEILVGIKKRIRVGLIGSGVLLVLGVDLGRWFLDG
jgi:hypothetical protein